MNRDGRRPTSPEPSRAGRPKSSLDRLVTLLGLPHPLLLVVAGGAVVGYLLRSWPVGAASAGALLAAMIWWREIYRPGEGTPARGQFPVEPGREGASVGGGEVVVVAVDRAPAVLVTHGGGEMAERLSTAGVPYTVCRTGCGSCPAHVTRRSSPRQRWGRRSTSSGAGCDRATHDEARPPRSMPWLNRRSACLFGVSGSCSIPRLKRAGTQRQGSLATPSAKRPMRRDSGARGLRPTPSSKPCSVCSGAAGCSGEGVIARSLLSLASFQARARIRRRPWGGTPMRARADHVEIYLRARSYRRDLYDVLLEWQCDGPAGTGSGGSA
jgi:hypothetical protein